MKFWDLFTYWWQITFHQHIVLSEQVILYGWHHNRSFINSIALNYSLIIAKYHIFASSIRVGSLDFDGFLLRLKDKLCILRTNSWRLKTKNLINLKKRGPRCFSRVPALCAYARVALENCNHSHARVIILSSGVNDSCKYNV